MTAVLAINQHLISYST